MNPKDVVCVIPGADPRGLLETEVVDSGRTADGGQPSPAAVGAPTGRRLARVRAFWPLRRILAVAVLAPALLALLVAVSGGSFGAVSGGSFGAGSGGSATVTPPGWTALAVLVAVTSATALATYLALPGTGRRIDVGCTPCASVSALSVLIAVFVIGSAPHDVPTAILALGVAAFGLRQRLTNASSCAV